MSKVFNKDWFGAHLTVLNYIIKSYNRTKFEYRSVKSIAKKLRIPMVVVQETITNMDTLGLVMLTYKPIETEGPSEGLQMPMFQTLVKPMVGVTLDKHGNPTKKAKKKGGKKKPNRTELESLSDDLGNDWNNNDWTVNDNGDMVMIPKEPQDKETEPEDDIPTLPLEPDEDALEDLEDTDKE